MPHFRHLFHPETCNVNSNCSEGSSQPLLDSDRNTTAVIPFGIFFIHACALCPRQRGRREKKCCTKQNIMNKERGTTQLNYCWKKWNHEKKMSSTDIFPLRSSFFLRFFYPPSPTAIQEFMPYEVILSTPSCFTMSPSWCPSFRKKVARFSS